MNLRKITSILLLFTGLILIFSGFVLYIMPHGRVAYWTDWRFLNLNKDQWSEIHIIWSITFIIFFIFHSIFNLKPLSNYFKKAKREVLISFLMTIFLISGAIINFYPFKTVMSFQEKVKNSWTDNKIAPKIPHGELLSLKKLMKKINIEKKEGIKRLKRAGIKFKSLNETVKEVAEKNNKKPVEIFKILKEKK